MKTILLIEDDISIVRGLKYFFEKEGYNVLVCGSKKEVLNEADKTCDIVILDVMLPDGNGFELIKHIKENICKHVIFLTAKEQEDDIVLGFDLGAEDYVVKPFRSRELLSRVNRILNVNKGDVLEVKNVVIDKRANKVFCDKKEVFFTALEFRILLMLFENVGMVMTRELILNKIWDESGSFVNDNTLTVYIKRIRQKLPDGIIRTIKNVGYIVQGE